MRKSKRTPGAEPGDDVKFRVAVDKEDFHLSEDPWRITVRNQWGQVKAVLDRSNCFYDSDGNWYFCLENVRAGLYYAYFRGSIEDTDYGKQRSVWNDRQVLLEVGLRTRGGRRCGSPVTYEQVWTVSVDGADYLCDCDGRYIYTSDGKRIQFTSETSEKIDDMAKVKMQMTGDEFLRLMEGKEPNQEVNTIPELMDAMRGISDDKTVIEEIDEKQEENEASDEDIDEIFDEDADLPGGGFDEPMEEEEGD